ncbi:hypothetical protein SKAU_G00290070 [Synaphobranchus kaupii]|uniref:Uncharacterized protein n=1 Tax=Synaphobranchus kaupii TaxID=118154 RepID=A0A9Q1ETJ7_SYNKA|nr:hypothetical protein SKAU_G00290070 [Synaphobranchus kaupii]
MIAVKAPAEPWTDFHKHTAASAVPIPFPTEKPHLHSSSETEQLIDCCSCHGLTSEPQKECGMRIHALAGPTRFRLQSPPRTEEPGQRD